MSVRQGYKLKSFSALPIFQGCWVGTTKILVWMVLFPCHCLLLGHHLVLLFVLHHLPGEDQAQPGMDQDHSRHGEVTYMRGTTHLNHDRPEFAKMLHEIRRYLYPLSLPYYSNWEANIDASVYRCGIIYLSPIYKSNFLFFTYLYF